jgi:hypothetical protein
MRHETSRNHAHAPTRIPWRLRCHVLILATLVGVAVFAISLFGDAVFHGVARPVLLSDALTACIALVLTYQLLSRNAMLRMIDAQRLLIIAEVNHHVRNALTAVLYSVYLRSDPELKRITEDAVERIDWVLNDILPDVGNQNSSPTPEPRKREARSLAAG